MAYSKQTWDTTSYVNPTRMNHIEEGIYDASTNIADNLTTDDSTKALSAKQGKVLNDTKINPPDLSNITRQSLTSGTAIEVTSTGKWYCVTAENQSSGSCSAYILDSTNTNYLSATQTGDGEWKRTTTAWLYFPTGTKFYARAIFTYRGYLCSASQL